MEQGSLRVDANISVMPEGSETLGTRVEIKNINSFRNVALAIEYEANRQIKTLSEGGALRQETRRFIDGSGSTAAMREKEDADDYRYFPDPDIPPLNIGAEYIESLRASLGEPPETRKARYVGVYGMAASDADVILARKPLADFYDKIAASGVDPMVALSIVRGEIMRNTGEFGDERVNIGAEDVVRLLRMNKAGEIGANNMKKAIGIMMRGDNGIKNLDDIIGEHNMRIREDPDKLAAAVRDVLAANPAAVQSYKGGESKVFGFFMGQCNKTLRGSVQPKTLENELRAQLERM
jgi:aspartyl-tRNA(Asn)/glutamyl-tRNA(Gln) amidotransferase subunit B